MLIDQNGKIVYTTEDTIDGKNDRINLEQDFEDLLAGKEITVKNMQPNKNELSQD